MIKIEKINELYIRLICEKSIASEIYEHFSFFVPGYQYMAKYRYGLWDGKINLFSLKTKLFPLGLLANLLRLCKQNNWPILPDKDLKLDSFDLPLENFVNDIIPELKLDPYDFQLDTFIKSIKFNRSLVLSPTRKWKIFYHLLDCEIFARSD